MGRFHARRPRKPSLANDAARRSSTRKRRRRKPSSCGAAAIGEASVQATYVSETISHGIHDRGGYKEVDLKALGFFEMDPSNATLKDVPPQYRALDGQKVLLKGEIFAPHDVSNIKQFELVYSMA